MTVLDPEARMKALADGQVDAAFIRRPFAGCLNKSALHDARRVVPLARPAMRWRAAIGVPRGDAALRDRLDGAIDAERDAIAALAAKYGLPSGEALTAGEAASLPSSPAIPIVPAAAGSAPPAPAPAPQGTDAAASAEVPAKIAAGKEIFNGMCAHCRGPDAVQSDHRIDLRRLHLRCGVTIDQVFEQPARHGRPDKGMPNWTGVHPENQIAEPLAFPHTVRQPGR